MKQKEISKLQLLVTEACNLRCTYCPIKKQPVNMTWEIAKKAIDIHFQNFASNLWYIVEFFGGEPMVNFDLVNKTMEYIKEYEQKHNFRVTYRMVTNGTLVDKKFVDFMINNPYFFIKLSCDGIKEAHDKNRKTVDGKGSFNLVEKALNLFKENDLFKNKRVQVGTVCSPNTVQYLYKNYKFFADFDDNLSFDYNLAYNMEWRERDWKDLKKQQEMIIKDEKIRLLNGKKCRDGDIFDVVKRKTTNDFSTHACQAARKKGLAIAPNGDIFICPYFESFLRDKELSKQKDNFYLGNIMNYEKLDQTKWCKTKCQLSKLSTSNIYKECKKCKNKQYCYWTKCYGANYVKNKDMLQLNKSVCQALDHYLPPIFKFHCWLKKQNLLDQYLENFGFVRPEKRPVNFIKRDLRK